MNCTRCSRIGCADLLAQLYIDVQRLSILSLGSAREGISIMAMLSRPFDLLRTYVGSLTWAPFVQISRSTVLGLLQRIQQGRLTVTDCDGSVTLCGAIKDGAPKTELKVLKEAFWVRVLLFADMVRRPRPLNGFKQERERADLGAGFCGKLHVGRVLMSRPGQLLPSP